MCTARGSLLQLQLHCLFLQCLHLSVCTYSVYKHVVPTSQIDININKNTFDLIKSLQPLVPVRGLGAYVSQPLL
jgi:hypothetical protein